MEENFIAKDITVSGDNILNDAFVSLVCDRFNQKNNLLCTNDSRLIFVSIGIDFPGFGD